MERKPVVIPEKKTESHGSYFTTVKKESLQFIPSGSTLLDCVIGGGWPLGRMSNIVGDKSSGKTLLAIEACANCNYLYPDAEMFYLEAEAAFDKDYAQALGMPIEKIDFIEELSDFTIEGWFEHLESVTAQLAKSGKPALYIVDSLDALSDRAEKGRKIDEGTFGGNKPKMIGQLFRRLTKEIENTQLHLMIISQIRDNIGVSFGEKHTRTGGKAMDFYASQILWLAQLKKLDRTIRKQKRVYGVQIKAKCKKNKVGLPFRECEFPIIFGYGVDDVTSMMTWLDGMGDTDYKSIFSNLSSVTPDAIKALPMDVRRPLLTQLQEVVVDTWQEIENNFIPKVSKY